MSRRTTSDDTVARGRPPRRGWLARRGGLARRARLLLVGLALAAGAANPSAARAADVDDEMDARLAGYGNKSVAIKSNTTLTFLLFIGLVIVGCVPLFKAAKRD